MTPTEAAARLREVAASVRPRLTAVADSVGILVEARAKAIVGVKQDSWDDLKDSTKEDKARKGYGSAPDYDPLLRTGQMRDSIEHVTVTEDNRIIAVVGSDDKVAVYQEFGTSNIPSRPFISLAMMEGTPDALELLEEVMRTLFEEE